MVDAATSAEKKASSDLDVLAADQQQKYQTFTGHPSSAFLLSWTLTQSNPFGSTCISDLVAVAHAALDGAVQSWVMQSIISRDKIPNVVYTDFVNDQSVSLMAAMYLNYLF